MNRRLKPRDLVIDNHDRIGIVVEQTRKPSRKWIMEQIDASVRDVGDCTWWKVMPLSVQNKFRAVFIVLCLLSLFVMWGRLIF